MTWVREDRRVARPAAAALHEAVAVATAGTQVDWAYPAAEEEARAVAAGAAEWEAAEETAAQAATAMGLATAEG